MSSVILVALEQAALLLLISLHIELNLIIKTKILFNHLDGFHIKIMTCKKSWNIKKQLDICFSGKRIEKNLKPILSFN